MNKTVVLIPDIYKIAINRNAELLNKITESIFAGIDLVGE